MTNILDPNEAATLAKGQCWERLERAWHEFADTHQAPVWSQFLPEMNQAGACSEWIVNLIQIDIEFRARADLPGLLVENYFAHPRLQCADVRLTSAQQAELIRWEYKQRWKNGDRPKRSDFLHRFPDLTQSLRDLRPRGVCTACRSAVTWPDEDSETTQCNRCRNEVKLEDVFPVRSKRTLRLKSTVSTRIEIPGFEILGELGHGGMGVVYKARQLKLNRFVALKMIRSGIHADSEELRRLVSEAEAVAQLQHPNIVQIHEITTWNPPGSTSPLPCLVMEFVDGGSLDKAIAGQVVSFDVCARFVETLARAMHWTHQRGIIHRDLKPSNILLSTSGAPNSTNALLGPPKITDFGLAKRLETGQGVTRSGDILGTPCYMAPEQARGTISAIGPRTDVYALGIILYEMLTGRPPFQRPGAYETIQEVLCVEPTPPGRVRPSTPRDLETICLKCLQKEPANRYVSAEELANDLGRFLRYEPIRARRTSRVGRLLRWYRRESKVARLTIAMVSVVVAALLIIGILGIRHHNQSKARFEAAIQDLDRELGIVGREEFTLVPQNDQIRRQLLEELAARCQALAQENNDHPDLRRKRAQVQLNLGKIDELLGRYKEAEAAYREAAQILARSRASDPDSTTDQALAKSYTQLASLLAAIGRFDDAGEMYRQALELQSQPGRDDDNWRTDRAETLYQRGRLQAGVGQLDEAEHSLRQAFESQRKLVEDQPDNANRQVALAVTETALANLLTGFARIAEAQELFDAAIARQDKLSSQSTAPVYQLGLARSLGARARMLEMDDRMEAAGADKKRAYETLRKLAQEHPHRPDYRVELAAAIHNAASDNVIGGYLEDHYREAVAIQEKLTEQFPELVENHRKLATSLNSLATWLNDKATNQKHWLPMILIECEALQIHERSDSIWKKLAHDYPQILAYQHGLGVSHQRFGIVLGAFGYPDRAEKMYRDSIAIQRELGQKYPNVVSHYVLLSALHNNLGVTHDRRKDIKAAEALFRQSVEYARKARQIHPRNRPTRFILLVQVKNIAEILLRTGRYQEAPQWISEIAHLEQPILYYNNRAFLLFEACIEAAQNDTTIPSDQRAELVKKYVELSIDAIRTIIGRAILQPGDAVFLRRHAMFNYLRARPEFEALCRELEAQTAKKP
jgi:serine/threonine protein kinase/tetratricopeptide (TPR) repeat protein